MKKTLVVLVTLIIGLTGCNMNQIEKINDNQPKTGGMTEAQARVIAEKTCIKGGEALGLGIYNENSKTWWFDANLNATKPGCNPACVVSEETKMAEINWRCTGLIEPKNNELTKDKTDSDLTEDLNAVIVRLFEEKYPENAGNIAVDITNQTADHARGSVSFEQGMAGGLWLAAKVDSVWRIVHDGNGSIPCSLSSYGFPAEMLADCAG